MATDRRIEQIAEHVSRMACASCKTVFDISGREFFFTIACPSCGAAQVVPARIGSFLLVGHLGSGGMAGVYEAYDQGLGRRVALKLMHLELGADPKFVDNFLREARAAAQINHPNVVQIYQVGQQNGQPYIVMELLKGGRLDEHTNAGRHMDELTVLQIGQDAALGLQAAAAIQLVHGDIKPANILFDKKGTAKIADFGLAKFQNKKKSDGGDIWGTPFYIAPEKVRRQPEDLRSDIYSLGGTLYHALTGHPPFDGKDTKEVVLARLQDLPTPMSEYRRGLAPETIMLIARMLEPDPARRYPTYPSLLSDIKSTIQAVKNRPPDTVARLPSSTGVKPPRPPWLIPAVLVGLAVLGGLVFSMTGGKGRKPEPPPPAPGPAPAPAPVPPKPAPKPVPLPDSVAVRIDCGQLDKTLKDKGGRDWLPDMPYTPTSGWGYLTNGEHHVVVTKEAVKTKDDEFLYRNYRWVKSPGRLAYRFDIRTPGLYVLRLHFAETYFGSPAMPGDGKGRRILNVWINGKKKLDKLDIYATTGGAFIPLVKEFPVRADKPVTLNVELEPVKENTSLCAIELAPAPPK